MEVVEASTAHPAPAESEEKERTRFQVELEFVQCLANPNYLHALSRARYFEQEAFLNYLKYLQYWKEPRYARHLLYPQCLYFLDLLQDARFREAMARPDFCEFVWNQQFRSWRYGTETGEREREKDS